jgi:carboxylesterase
MARHTHLNPAPFLLPGGPVGVLLIHGYTGSPPEMRLIGDYLHARGLTVSAPLLPGHGTTPEEMNRCRWRDWTEHALRALAEIEQRCAAVFVGGLSMGSLITLYLAQERPEIRGAILYSPAVIAANRLIWLTPLMKHLIRQRPKSLKSDLTDPEAGSRMWSYEVDPVAAAHELLKLQLHVRRHLRRVTCPTLVFYSPLDTAIHPRSARFTFERIAAQDKELVTLYHSGHGLTVDSEWETVAERTYQFITQRS